MNADDRARLVCGSVIIALLSFTGGFAYGHHRGWTHGLVAGNPVVQDPRWAIVAIPPCRDRPLPLQAVGLTFAAAYRNAADLVPPSRDRVGHRITARPGQKVCP